ncbi:MAG: response regulator [Verrucomicrobia bacterium]|nr:response regulator [Verrucomicrobiota bacterium]
MSLAKDNSAAVRRILAVDDEATVLAGLQETLTQAGHTVVTASSPAEALDKLRAERFAVVLSDFQMGGCMNGLEFLAKARELQPDAARILLTAVLNFATVFEHIQSGLLYRFMVKPWLREELLTNIHNALERFEFLQKLKGVETAASVAGLERALEEQRAASAAQNAKLGELNDALQQNLQHSVELCVKTMQTFYPSLGVRARRAFEVCKAMAATLKLSGNQRQVLEISAWLHDIGLMGISRSLIRRWEQQPASLDENEFRLVRSHPVIGAELVHFGSHLQDVRAVIRAHHERLDGTGYPDEIKGEQIPWLARLLAVAIAFADSTHDALTTIEAIRMGAGTKFDPEAVRVLVRAMPQAGVTRNVREVLLSELRPGMVLAKGVYTANGLLIMPDGQKLTNPFIGILHNHNAVNPISQSLLVYC